jgi:hypothetical protein
MALLLYVEVGYWKLKPRQEAIVKEQVGQEKEEKFRVKNGTGRF